MKRNKNQNLPGNLEGCVVYCVSNMWQKRLPSTNYHIFIKATIREPK